MFHLIRKFVLVNLSAFISGTIGAWSSPVGEKLSKLEDNPFGRILTDDELSWLGSLVLLGSVIGPWFYGFSMEKFGRKITILITAFPALISQIILISVADINWYYFARLLAGISQAGAYCMVPVYVAEISETKIRGMLTSSVIGTILLGMLFSFSVGPYVTVNTFNVLLLVPPVLLIFGTIFLVPESPHYFIYKNDQLKAEQTLKQVRGTQLVHDELFEIMKNANVDQGTLSDLFKTKAARRSFVMCLNLQFGVAFCGVGPLLTYSETIFSDSGSSIDSAISTIIAGIVQFVVCILLAGVVDRFGRRIMVLISTFGVILCQLVFAIYSHFQEGGYDVSYIDWIPLFSIVSLVICITLGLGPLSSVLVGELFPLNVKSFGSAIVCSVYFVVMFLLTFFYKSMVNSIGTGPTFEIYSAFLVVLGIYFYVYLIETKGRSLQEIQDDLNT